MTTTNSNLPKYPVVVEGQGPSPCPFMVIGEAPGRKEIESGIPFCGPSGTLLDTAIGVAGRRRYTDVYVTNAFKGDVGTGNRNPTQDELDDHRPLLNAEIYRVQPRRILLLGRVATETILGGVGRMGDAVGKEYVQDGRIYIPCWHPAYVLRKRGQTAIEFVSTVTRFLSD